MMTPKQHQVFMSELKTHQEEVVQNAIETYVNGGVRGIRKTLDEYIRADIAWKKENQTALDNMKNLTAGWKMILSFFGSVAIIIGGLYALKKLFGL